MAFIYNVNGEIIEVGGGSSQNYDAIVKGINHRGYSTVAPENTIPAFKMSKQRGFNYVETDISWTSDDIPVLSHDNDISRCSDGTGTISSMTYEQLLQYDFGSWKGEEWTGTKIPTAEEFLKLCRAIDLHPYLELKNSFSEAKVQALIDLVNACGMKGHVSYISFNATWLGYVKTYDPYARIGYLPASTIYASSVTTAQSLQTETNDVFISADNLYNNTDAVFDLVKNAGIPCELWTVDNANTILTTNAYVTGFTSNSLIAGKILFNANIN